MTVATKPTIKAAVTPIPMTAALGSPPSSVVFMPVGVAPRVIDVTDPELVVGTPGPVVRLGTVVGGITGGAVVVVGGRVTGGSVVGGRVVTGVVHMVVVGGGVHGVVVVEVVGGDHVVVGEVVVDDEVDQVGQVGGAAMVVSVVAVV